MDMTKEQRREANEIKGRLRRANGDLSRVTSRCNKARRKSASTLKKAIAEATRAHRNETKALDREENAERKHHERTTGTLRDRLAVLQGRLAS